MMYIVHWVDTVYIILLHLDQFISWNVNMYTSFSRGSVISFFFWIIYSYLNWLPETARVRSLFQCGGRFLRSSQVLKAWSGRQTSATTTLGLRPARGRRTTAGSQSPRSRGRAATYCTMALTKSLVTAGPSRSRERVKQPTLCRAPAWQLQETRTTSC